MNALDHPSVARVRSALLAHGSSSHIHALDDSARTAQEAAEALGVEVGQIASSIVFGLPPLTPEAEPHPLLVVTSGAHRVDTQRVAEFLGVPRLLRADADFVRRWSGFAIGGVSPLARSGAGWFLLIRSPSSSTLISPSTTWCGPLPATRTASSPPRPPKSSE